MNLNQSRHFADAEKQFSFRRDVACSRTLSGRKRGQKSQIVT